MLNIAPLSKPKPIKALKKRKTRKKKTSRQLLEKQADVLVREIVLRRDRFCVCPSPKNGHGNIRTPGHLISRTRQSLRWSLINTNEQCQSCNFLHEHKPEIYTAWFIRQFGAEIYQELVKEAEDVSKLSTEQLQTLCDELAAIKQRQETDKEFSPRFSQKEILAGSWRRKENEQQSQTTNQVYQVSGWEGMANPRASGDGQHDQENRDSQVSMLQGKIL